MYEVFVYIQTQVLDSVTAFAFILMKAFFIGEMLLEKLARSSNREVFK